MASISSHLSDQDGKDDYCYLGKDTASLTCYLNKGADPKAPGGWSWQGPHVVAPGAGNAKGADVFFADINGRALPLSPLVGGDV